MFDRVTENRRFSPGRIVPVIVVAGAAAGIAWFAHKANQKAEEHQRLADRFQKYEDEYHAVQASLKVTALPGMSLQLPEGAAISDTYPEGEAMAAVGEEVARVHWKMGELRSEADFGQYVRIVAGSFVGVGMVLTTGCEHPEAIELDARPGRRCEEILISSMTAKGHVPPGVLIMTGTCGERVVDLITTSPLIASRMQSSFHCTGKRP